MLIPTHEMVQVDRRRERAALIKQVDSEDGGQGGALTLLRPLSDQVGEQMQRRRSKAGRAQLRQLDQPGGECRGPDYTSLGILIKGF